MNLPAAAALGSVPSAFAAACRLSRTDAELLDRCREALVSRYQSRAIWFEISTPEGMLPRVGPADGHETAQEVGRLRTGETQVVILAGPEVAGTIRPMALSLAHGLSVVVELRSILLERQAALDD
ncbi:MAG TPA: hypothetical protein PK948_01440, partial [Gemmatimonadales bacterium]|nr:hypothetical protein [Gemmatimonadales bacterium]